MIYDIDEGYTNLSELLQHFGEKIETRLNGAKPHHVSLVVIADHGVAHHTCNLSQAGVGMEYAMRCLVAHDVRSFMEELLSLDEAKLNEAVESMHKTRREQENV